MATAHVIFHSNPFDPGDCTRYQLGRRMSVRQCVRHYTGAEEFARPTICLHNGRPLLRNQWGRVQVHSGDVVSFATLPEGGLEALIFITIAVAVASIAIALTIPKPPTPGNTAEPDPVYFLQGQRNQVRLNSPVEVPYGRVRLWPSYAARAWNRYEGNQQYQFQLFCLGVGEYNVEDIYIEDTPIANFPDVEWELYGPGENPALFSNRVVTSPEIGGSEMFGPNEAEYGSWIGPFVANPANSTTTTLEVDVVFPQGLYTAESDGSLSGLQVTAEFEYRAIDDNGDAAGSWTSLFTLDKTLSTNTPQRFTLTANLPAGRYEVRGRRTNDKATSTATVNVLRWDALRAFLPSTTDYGNVTLLAVKARATNNLNDNASTRVNCVATRKLRAWDKDAQAWTAPATTRSAVWAFLDLFQAAYGGQLGDSYFDLDGLADLDAVLDADELYFDHVFDQRATLWEAARLLCRAVRGVPMLNGSRLGIVRDTPATLPVAGFSPDNMVAGSFRMELRLANTGDTDGVEVEYVDPTTWQAETVLCLLGTDVGANPERFRFYGCTDRDRAYREGLYMRASQLYLRTSISFTTGREGHIPQYGDLIAVSHDVPRWGTAGLLVSIEDGVATLSEPVAFGAGRHYLAIRKKDGSVAGPFEVTAGDTDLEVVFVVDPRDSNLVFDPLVEPVFCYFGAAEASYTLAKVTGLQPDGEEEVQVRATVYNPVVYTYDTLTAPALGSAADVPSVPALPTVTGLAVDYVADERNLMLVSWNPALGATHYELETSPDGVTWTSVEASLTLPFYRLGVEYGTLYVRVAGVNLARGTWATWDGMVGTLAGAPDNVSGLVLAEPFTGGSASLEWDADPLATSYEVKVYAGATLLRTATPTAAEYEYTLAFATADGGPDRALRFVVKAVNGVGSSNVGAELYASNPLPAAVAEVALLLRGEDGSDADYAFSWAANTEEDFSTFKLYVSTSASFTPGVGTLVYTGSTPAYEYTRSLVGGGHPRLYYYVETLDTWGTAGSLSELGVLPGLPYPGGFGTGFDPGFAGGSGASMSPPVATPGTGSFSGSVDVDLEVVAPAAGMHYATGTLGDDTLPEAWYVVEALTATVTLTASARLWMRAVHSDGSLGVWTYTDNTKL